MRLIRLHLHKVVHCSTIMFPSQRVRKDKAAVFMEEISKATFEELAEKFLLGYLGLFMGG